MATSTEQINDLIAAGNAWKAAVDQDRAQHKADLAAAVAAAADTKKTFYVHSLGNDADLGEQGSPLATIHEAIGRTVPGGVTEVFLQTDILHEHDSFINNAVIHLRADAGISPIVSFGPDAINTPTSTCACFTARYGGATIVFNGVDVALGQADAGITRRSVIIPSALTNVAFFGVEFHASAGENQSLIEGTAPFGLSVRNSVAPPEMDGRWVSTENAGTDPAGVALCAYTNLATF